jgi:hypothetical protein
MPSYLSRKDGGPNYVAVPALGCGEVCGGK